MIDHLRAVIGADHDLGGDEREPATADSAEAGAAGGSGLALFAAKALACPYDGLQVIDHAVVLIQDGKIRALGPRGELDVPAGYEVLDLGDAWLTPGFIDLHCHAAGASLFSGVNDLNDMVYLVNPGLRASSAVEPWVWEMRQAIAGGITTVLYIPGSGTNIGGQGVLVKTAFDFYEENLVRDPGSMKLAQWGNPESWGPGVGMAFENWNTRTALKRGIAYAKRWQAYERDKGPKPRRNIEFDVFQDLLANQIAISVHTQV